MVRCSCSEWRRADSLLAKFNVSLICVISRFGEAPSPHSFGDEIKFSTDRWSKGSSSCVIFVRMAVYVGPY